MLTRRLMTISCAMVMAVGLVNAQEFPSQPIRIVIPYAPGGGSDILARPVAVDMSQRLKQPVIIDNKGGAGGNIGAQFVARSAPDGYNLMMANNSHVINQFIYKNPGFEMGDLAPVSLVGTSPIIVVVHKSSPVQSLADFVSLARKNPGKLNFGSAGVGTPGHLAPLLFNKQADIKVVHIAYKGSGPATLALLQKEVDIVFSTPVAAEPHIKSGEFRALAVTSKNRFSAFPMVPTIAESGLPGLGDYQMEIWWGLLAPAKTDPAVLDKLNAAVTAAVRDPKISERWTAQGMIPTTTTRTEFQTLVKNELQKWEKVVRENGITVD